MTIAHLVETLLAKTCALSGKMGGDGTCFQGTSVSEIAAELKACGLPQYGKERMYSGYTGEALDALIFIGPVYYQRLKHMVEDKIHSRGGFGPVTQLTRQPLDGRARDGGLRFGEMEKDACLAHGAAGFLNDKLLTCSDAYRAYVCQTCGGLCDPPKPKGSSFCRRCNTHGGHATATIPYATKLMIQELEAMGVSMRLQVKPVSA